MRLLGNTIWIVFGGFVMGLGCWIAGALIAITIIGIPFALQHVKLAKLSLMPFGKEIVALPSRRCATYARLYGRSERHHVA